MTVKKKEEKNKKKTRILNVLGKEYNIELDRSTRTPPQSQLIDRTFVVFSPFGLTFRDDLRAIGSVRTRHDATEMIQARLHVVYVGNSRKNTNAKIVV